MKKPTSFFELPPYPHPSLDPNLILVCPSTYGAGLGFHSVSGMHAPLAIGHAPGICGAMLVGWYGYHGGMAALKDLWDMLMPTLRLVTVYKEGGASIQFVFLWSMGQAKV